VAKITFILNFKLNLLKRENAGEKLKDIEINDSGESDVEFQDSIEQQVSEDAINDIPDNSDEIQDHFHR
jgi:predicted ATPase